MPDLSGDFQTPQVSGFSDPASLFPSEHAFDIGGIPSAMGVAANIRKMGMANTLMDAQKQRLPMANSVAMGVMRGQQQRLGTYNDLKQQEMANEYSQLKGKPAGEFIDASADLWPSMKDKDPVTKAQMYGKMRQQWAATHPGMQLPPELSEYNPDVTDQHLQTAYDMRRFSIENEKKVEAARMAHLTEIEKARIQAYGSIVGQRGRGVEAAELKANEDKKNTKRIGDLKKSLADPSIKDEDKETMSRELESLVMPKFEEDQTKRFPETARAYMDPQHQESFDTRSRAARNQYMDSHGLRIKMERGGKSYMIPRSQYSAALQEGYTKGK